MGYSPRGRKESDTTEQLSLTRTHPSLFPSFFLSFFSLLHFLFFSPNFLVIRKAISSGQYPGIRKRSECMLQLLGVMKTSAVN